MRLVRIITLLFCCIVASSVSAKEWRLAVCYGDQATEVDTNFRQMIGKLAASTFHLADDKSETTLKARPCVKEPDLSCYADTEAIFCREEPLALVVRMAAWLAAESAFIYYSSEGDQSSLNISPNLSWVDALLLGHAEGLDGDRVFADRVMQVMNKRNLTPEYMDAIYSLVTDLYVHTNNKMDIDPDNVVLAMAHQLYVTIGEYAFAFLLGHEAYHFNGNDCPVEGVPNIKAKGIWKEISGLQLKGGLFDDRIGIDKHEARADLCGYRWLELKAASADRNLSPVLSAMSKRVAIDLLAGPLLTGMRAHIEINALGEDAPKIQVVDGYLYPQSRLVLAASTLRQSEIRYPGIVKICNTTAKAIVTIIQNAYRKFPESSGIIPDSLLAELAPGVEASWNGGPWSESSVACTLEKMK